MGDLGTLSRLSFHVTRVKCLRLWPQRLSTGLSGLIVHRVTLRGGVHETHRTRAGKEVKSGRVVILGELWWGASQSVPGCPGPRSRRVPLNTVTGRVRTPDRGSGEVTETPTSVSRDDLRDLAGTGRKRPDCHPPGPPGGMNPLGPE